MKGEKKEVKRLRKRLKRDKQHGIFFYRCFECHRTAEEAGLLTVDHIKPRSLGGTDELDNLQILCRQCNSRKGSFYQ